MVVNIFGLDIKAGRSVASTKYIDSKFITLTKNLQKKLDKGGDLLIQLEEDSHRNFGVSDISTGKHVSLLLGNIDNQIRYNYGSSLKITGDFGCKFTCRVGEICRLGAKDDNKSHFFGDIFMNSNYISNVHDPAGRQDVATKNYVDTRYVCNNVGFVPDLFTNKKNKNGFEVSASSELKKMNSEEKSTAHKVFNNKIGEWRSDGVNTNFWIQIQCPEPVRIYKISLSAVEKINNWILQGNNDTHIWDNLYRGTSIPNTVSFYNVITLAGYRNYRIFIVNAEGENPGLNHWQLYTLDEIMIN